MKSVYNKLLVVTLIIIAFTVGCSATTKETAESTSEEMNTVVKGEYKSMDQKQANDLLQEGNVILLDVRTQEEFNEGYIKGANLLTLDTIQGTVESAYPDKNATYLVYCRSGNRSKQATNLMVELGYTDVYDIGGINTWSYEIVK